MQRRLVLTAELVFASGNRSYIASEKYTSRSTDAIGIINFSGFLNDVQYERSGTTIIWKTGNLFSPLSQIEVPNSGGFFDWWVDEEVLDQPIIFRLGYNDQAYDDFTQVGAAIGDRIEIVDTESAKVFLKSKLRKLEGTLTDAYPSDAPLDTNQLQHKPFLLGGVRFSDTVFWDDSPVASDTPAAPIPRSTFFASDETIQLLSVYDEGLLIAPPYEFAQTWRHFTITDLGSGFERINDGISGEFKRQVVEGIGNMKVGDMIFEENFDDWTGNDPDGWYVSETGTAVIEENPTGFAEIRTSADPTTWMERTFSGMVTGEWYIFEYDLRRPSDCDKPFTIRTDDDVTYHEAYTQGIHRVSFQCTGNNTLRLGIWDSVGDSQYRLGFFRIYEAFPILTVREALEYLTLHKGGLTTDDVDIASLDNLINPQIGYFTPRGDEPIIDLIQKILDSVAGFAFTSALNKIRFFGLQEPAAVADFTIREKDLLSTVSYEQDLAPGLSAEMKYDINYAVHSDDEVPHTTDTESEALRNEYRIARTTETLHSSYAEANTRPPMVSVLRRVEDAMLVIDHFCSLYTARRKFYNVTAVVYDMAAYLIEPGQTVQIEHNRLMLSGRYLVMYAKSGFLSNQVTLILWG